MRPVVPALPSVLAESYAEVRPCIGHRRVGEDSVLPNLDNTAFTDWVSQLRICKLEDKVID